MTCSPSMELDLHVSFPEGSLAIAQLSASRVAMKSVLGVGSCGLRADNRALPAEGSIETRPIFHASAWNVFAVRSYWERTPDGSFQLAVMILAAPRQRCQKRPTGRMREQVQTQRQARIATSVP
jgi:hypothetical protein